MKLTLKHFNIAGGPGLHASIKSHLNSLTSILKIDEALVSLSRYHASSPAFHVKIQLVTPGPDVFAESNDHTLQAAISKVVKQLQEKVSRRSQKRLQKIKSNLSSPAECSRGVRR